jgi:hypothetical protein
MSLYAGAGNDDCPAVAFLTDSLDRHGAVRLVAAAAAGGAKADAGAVDSSIHPANKNEAANPRMVVGDEKE